MGNAIPHSQRGFTLIEMSIVLVIIGLIVGGILKGQELIESSRQKNMISQVDRFKAATTTFVDRFKGLPGDFSRVTLLQNSGLLDGGDDSGVIGTTQTNVAGLDTMENNATDEPFQYFNMLLAAGLGTGGSMSNTNPSCFSGLCNTGSPLPASAFPQSGLSMVYGTHEGLATGGSSKRAHWLRLSRWVAPGNGLTGGVADGVLSPERAYQIDSKYDDGNANAGNIRSLQVGTDCGASAADYVASTTAVACHLVFAVE